MLAAGCRSSSTDQLAISVTRGACGGSWHADGGVRTFAVRNGDIVTTEVDLVDPRTGGVYAEVESLAPNATRPMRVDLGGGDYAFRCFPEDADMVTGPTVHLTGVPGAAAVRPISDLDLTGAVASYRRYVTAGLATLSGKVHRLVAVMESGDRGRIEAAWLDAHLAYARLGAAYGTFGDAADAIDGTPDGLPRGVRDSDFSGFHRIEYGLWHGAAVSSLRPLAVQLEHDVDGLAADFGKEQVDPRDLPLRAHEIMENALQFELTGSADQGSGTSLATALANVEGTQAVLDALAPVMAPRYVQWPAVATWMNTMRTALTSARTAGRWTRVAELSVVQREHIDAAAGGLLEALAPIAAIGDVRRTS
jgi:iron uptake system EfeUOB component EfeO/EfeM